MTFIFAFLLLASIITLMAVGVIFQNKPIKGSCGGMAALGMVSNCEICGGDRQICEDVNDNQKSDNNNQQNNSQNETASFYDAASGPASKSSNTIDK